MQIIKLEQLTVQSAVQFAKASTLPYTATAIGNFDGVHLGHQEVISQAVTLARANQWQAGVMTFHPHPREVLGEKRNGGYLTPMDDRFQYLSTLGVDIVYILQFNQAIAQMSPETFIQAYIEGLKIQHVITGFDFSFGHKGNGDPQMLADWADSKKAFQYTKVLPITLNDDKISTTRIKALLDVGDVQTAGMLLGRYYAVEGRVIHGEKQGRNLGFPTANLTFEQPYYMPKLGVYAVRCHIEGNTYAGVLNYGKKPTFHEGKLPLMEVHLIDQNLDLYGKVLKVELVTYLRSEQKFSSITALTDQIKLDVERARAIFSNLA